MNSENSTYENAANFEVFNDCLDALTIDLIKSDLGIVEQEQEQTGLNEFREDDSSKEITDEEMRKSAWLASVLASSDDETHNRKALSFGILAYLRYQENNQNQLYEQYLYIILSRVGNLPAFNNVRRAEGQLSFENQLINSLDSVLGMELESNLNEYEIDEGKVLSSFQKQIYDLLLEGKNVAISGPTSSGKSFVLQEYIDHQTNSEESFEAIYIVPTRALIAEVSRDLSTRHEDIEVRTGAYFEDDIESSDEEDTDVFLVVTPERCLKLIDPETRKQIDPDLVFLDEVQNVEEDQRGVLYESIIESLTEYYPSAQIVAAGPYLDNPGKTLKSLTDRDVEEVTTAFTPILQLKTTLRFISQDSRTNRKMKLVIHSPSGNKKTVCVPEPEEMTYTEVKSNKKNLYRKLLTPMRKIVRI
jgi:DNA replication protein DnaC